ncbi:MAG: hypothetical protein ACJAS4_003097 [Bacteriovoracaceae bacterium]|jgi:hypothetical protein
MKIILFLTVLLFSLGPFAADKFGSAITMKKSISLDNAIKNHSNGTNVLVKAKVGKVCKQKGCWMTLTGSSKEYRVTFKDYDFFVPMSLIGKMVFVEGKIIKKEMSLKETKHYIKDEGGDPSKVTIAKTEYRLVASGVEVIK